MIDYCPTTVSQTVQMFHRGYVIIKYMLSQQSHNCIMLVKHQIESK